MTRLRTAADRSRVSRALLALVAALALITGSLRTTSTSELAFALAQASAVGADDAVAIGTDNEPRRDEPAAERRSLDRDAVVTDGSSRLGDRPIVKRAASGDPLARGLRRQGFTSPLDASVHSSPVALASVLPTWSATRASDGAPSWRDNTSPTRARARLMVFLN